MKPNQSARKLLIAIAGFWLALAATNPATAASATELSEAAHAELNSLYTKAPAAKALGEKAKAILVFPSITKGGLVVGGQYGEGVLIQDGKSVAYYNTVSASVGLQAGIEKYGYMLFFMTDKALESLHSMKGFEVGVGPSVVVVDEGMAKNASTTTMRDDIYAFIFSQKGLMADVSLQGTKITKIDKK